ncbi:MAG TPA: uS10/mL48 family ribosomal protein [Halobacteriales archaeon]|nr:uS10/mL48 family ribosomal protein [Halobacteriales archaeon]
MTFVTKLTLRSGDRAALDGVVESILERARRKGAEMRGPHAEAPRDHHARLYARLDGDESRQYGTWTYPVYTRRLSLVGREEFARLIIGEGFPDSVHVEAEVEQTRPAGRA